MYLYITPSSIKLKYFSLVIVKWPNKFISITAVKVIPVDVNNFYHQRFYRENDFSASCNLQWATTTSTMPYRKW